MSMPEKDARALLDRVIMGVNGAYGVALERLMGSELESNQPDGPVEYIIDGIRVW